MNLNIKKKYNEMIMTCILCGEEDSKKYGCHHLYCEHCMSIDSCLSCRDIKYKLRKFKRTKCELEKEKIKKYIIKYEGVEFYNNIFIKI